MDWDRLHWNHSLREHYSRLIALRRRHRVLRSGTWGVLFADDLRRVCVAFRQWHAEHAIIVINAGATPVNTSIPLAGLTDIHCGTYVDQLSGNRYHCRCERLQLHDFPPGQGAVLMR